MKISKRKKVKIPTKVLVLITQEKINKWGRKKFREIVMMKGK
jgi:hypothetical protein